MRLLFALIRKETLQIVRDPSSILIAFVLPLILLFIYGYGVNLDNNQVRIGIVQEEVTPTTTSLLTSFTNSGFFAVTKAQDRRELEPLLINGTLRGLVIIPVNFSEARASGAKNGAIQLITDGSEPNIATFVNNYTNGAVQVWQKQQAADKGFDLPSSPIRVESRFWYNPELKSRNFLIPGSIAIIMTLIGTLLTSMVVAREWERGTMEALMATPVSVPQILLGKLVPYYLLAIASMTLCFIVATLWYDVPFRGSFAMLFITTSLFLLAALGQGLFISCLAKNQFLAAQLAMITAFLPAFMLSGFIFEIASMPFVLRGITYAFAVRYFVTTLQTLFLTGTVWPLILWCSAAMVGIGFLFFALAARKTVKRLDA